MRRKYLLASGLLICLFVSAGAYGADVVYTAGVVDIRYSDGERVEALIGDVVKKGDTVITGVSGIAELEPAVGSLIKISPDTVFTVREVETGGEKRTVLSTALGAVKFAFTRNTDREPLIATQSTVAGIRGTELEVFAGSDGSVLMVVLDGAVELSAQGRAVALGPNEGVEVPPGEPPGEKFEVKRGQLDFSTWNGEREARILEDPIRALEGAADGLDSLIDEIDAIVPVFEEKRNRLEALRAELREEEDREKRKKRYAEVVYPLEVETSYLALNLRYYALSALSFRRFVLGTIYLRTRTRALTGDQEIEFDRFMQRYRSVLARYETHVTPHLVFRDI